MGLMDVLKAHTPTENSEFGPRKKLIGDAVCELKLEKITSKKGQEGVILRGTAIHPMPDPKGRQVTVEAGDEIAMMYSPSDDEQVARLLNDLFTAGVEYDREGSEAEVWEKMVAATAGKLGYVRSWARDKSEEDIEKYGADPAFFQRHKILSKSKVTAENSVPVLPF